MEDNESQRNVTPESKGAESQDVERGPAVGDGVKNVLVLLGLVPPLPVLFERSQEQIEAALGSTEREQRVAAVKALGRKDGDIFLSLIEKALHHEDRAVRATTVGLLGELKEHAPFDLLLEALKDNDWYVRACAVHELGCQIERAPILPLIEALRDEDESVRAEAVWALTRLREHAPDILLDSLHDSSRIVREVASEFMQERLELAFQDAASATSRESLEEDSLRALTNEHEQGRPALSVLPGKLPSTGPLLEVSMRGIKERVEPTRKQKEHGSSKKGKARGRQGSSWVGKALVALLILGIGVSWNVLVQHFQQSSAASQGNLSCVFHPGSSNTGNAMAWPVDPQNKGLLAIAGAGSTIETYDVNSCRHIGEYRQESGSSVLALKWLSDGLYIANLTADGRIEVLLEQGNEPSQVLFTTQADPGGRALHPLLAWSENGQYLAINRGDNRAEMWSIPLRQSVGVYTSSYGVLSALAWSPNNSEIAAATVFDPQSKGARIQLWNVSTKAIDGRDINMSTTVAGMAWSQDGENLLIYDQNAVVSKWSRQTQNYNSLNPGVYASLQQFPSFKLALAYAPDSTRYAISAAGEIQIWDATAAQQIGTVADGLSEIDQLSWSADGHHIAASSSDGTVQIWKIR